MRNYFITGVVKVGVLKSYPMKNYFSILPVYG
jgi:hypothetical protein